MSANLLTLNSSKTEFLIIGLKQQLSKIDKSSVNITHSARNLGFIFDENLTFSDQISSLSKSCYSHICEPRCIRPYLDSKTASTIAAFIVHSKLDCCNSIYYNLPKSQIYRLQQIKNCLARRGVHSIGRWRQTASCPGKNGGNEKSCIFSRNLGERRFGESKYIPQTMHLVRTYSTDIMMV